MRCSLSWVKTYLSILFIVAMFLLFASVTYMNGVDHMTETTRDLMRLLRRPRPVRKPAIPHIIHQMYKSTVVPEPYHKYMQSWIKFNPTYKYYFWTDDDIRNLIRDYYPDYLQLYDSYKYALQRADAGRYFILYHYGGIYVDADFQCLKPFDDYLANHSSCILAPEPVQESLLLWNLDVLYTNAIMICQQEHEFIWQIIQGLPDEFKSIPEGKNSAIWTVQTTGPMYMKKVLDSYMNSSNPDIYLAPYEELVPISDVTQTGTFKHKCKKLAKVERYKKTCEMLIKSNYKITDTSRAYSVHHWLHLGYEQQFKRLTKMKKSEVSDVMQNVTVLRYSNVSDSQNRDDS